MIIKVCGMRDTDNIRAIDTLEGVDWMGFIFYPPSSRYVDNVPTYLPQNKARVGVFVNETLQNITERMNSFHFNLIQLHGHETPDFCKQLRNTIGKEIQIIKMIQINEPSDLDSIRQYEGIVDYFLFETKCKEYGGSGKQFDWDILTQYEDSTPFLITGGIKPADVEKIQSFHHPKFAGIDLNSGFEISPAMKDAKLIQEFINKLNRK